MTCIMCTAKLWRRLGYLGRPPAPDRVPSLHGVALGSWAANVFRIDGRHLIIALNERTCLTLVFVLQPRRDFRLQLAGALATALADLGIPEAIVRAESGAVELEPLAGLTDLRLARTLDDLKFYCDLELDYHDDLRKVQRNLNDVPHPGRDPCVPVEAVRRLFQGSSTPTFTAH